MMQEASPLKALVLYESFFGNTRIIAESIAKGLERKAEVVSKNIKSCTPEELRSVHLLVIGCATRGFRPSPETHEFLTSLSREDVKHLAVASFDTRIDLHTIESAILRWIVDLGGYAAKPIAKKLEQKGARLIAEPMGFLVLDKEGPLKVGELERAQAWAEGLHMS